MRVLGAVLFCGLFFGCVGSTRKVVEVPALDYARSIQPDYEAEIPQVQFAGAPGPDTYSKAVKPKRSNLIASQETQATPSAHDPRAIYDFRRSGYSPSLFRESQGQGGLFRDFRAWKPMDLVTIVVSEVAQGRKSADTQVDSTTTIEAAVSRFLGIETSIGDRNTQLLPSALVDASTTSQFDGQGETIRRDSLTGTISAMVVEVLPSGVLRVEGKKIISVNNEEQTMILSGLVRPQDIDSRNRVRSDQLANMRIDYFGSGVISDVQSPGIITRLFHKLWPF